MSEELALTYVSGPSDPVTLADGPGTYVEVLVSEPPEVVWPVVTDINLPAEFSEEFQGAEWKDDARGLGACFVGRNRHSAVGEWQVDCYVDTYEQYRTFGWAVADAENPAARWRFDLTGEGGGTLLKFATTLGPGPSGLTPIIKAKPESEAAILYVRLKEHNTNMARTIEGIKAKIESEA